MRKDAALRALPAVAFGAVVAVAGRALAVPIPLYLSSGCQNNYCFPNIPHLPVVPFLAALLLAASFRPRLSREAVIARGLAVGLAAGLYLGLLDASAIPFRDPYFTLPYRVYGLGYVALVSALLVAMLVRVLRRGADERDRLTALALLSVVAFSVVASGIRRDPSALAALAGAATGAAAGRWAPADTIARARRVLDGRGAVIAIVAIAFALRILFGLQTLARTGPGMDFAVASDDGDSYFTLASGLVADPTTIGDVLGGKSYPPGYALFLAAILAVTHGSLATVVAAQAALGAVSTLLVFVLARGVAGRTAGLVAAALFALDQNLIQNQSTLTAEALLVPLTLVAMWAIVRYHRSAQLKWIVAAAAALGVAFITRNLVALPLMVAALGWLFVLRRGIGSFLRDTAIFVAAVLIASAPVAVVTTVRDGAPRLTTQVASLSWTFDGGDEMAPSNTFLVQRDIMPFTDPVGSLGRFLADPLPVLLFEARVGPQRLSTLLFFWHPGVSDPLVLVNNIPYPNLYGDLFVIARLVTVGLAAIAFVRLRAWRRHPELGLFIAFTLLYVAVFSFVFPPYHPFRYRIPVEPLRYIAEAAGILIAVRWTARSWSRAPVTMGA